MKKKNVRKVKEKRYPVVVDTWTERERGWGSRPDGISVHLSAADHKAFVEKYNREVNNKSTVPDEYTVADGSARVIDATASLLEYLQDLRKRGITGIRAWGEKEALLLKGKNPFKDEKYDVSLHAGNLGQPLDDPRGQGLPLDDAVRRAKKVSTLGFHVTVVGSTSGALVFQT